MEARLEPLLKFLAEEHGEGSGGYRETVGAQLGALLFQQGQSHEKILALIATPSRYTACAEARRMLLLETGAHANAAALLSTAAAPDDGRISPTTLRHEAALLTLYGLHATTAAAHLAQEALDDTAAFMAADAVHQTLTLAQLADGAYEQLVGRVEHRDDTTGGDLVVAALVATDHLHEPMRACRLLKRALALGSNDPMAIELGLEVAPLGRGALNTGQLLERKLEILRHEATTVEAISACYQLAMHALQHNDLPSAVALVDRVDQALHPTSQRRQRDFAADWSARMLMLTRQELVLRGGDAEGLATIYLSRADTTTSSLAGTLRVRAAYLLDAIDPSDERIDMLVSETIATEPHHTWAQFLREYRLLLARDLRGLAEHYETLAGTSVERSADLLRRAALCAELAGMRDETARLRLLSLKTGSDPFAAADLYRLRQGNPAWARRLDEALDALDPEANSAAFALVQALRAAEAYLAGEDARASAIAGGVLDGDRHATLCAWIIEELEEHVPARLRKLAREVLADATVAPKHRAYFLRLRAATEGDGEKAIALLETALALVPDSVETLRALAEAYRHQGDPLLAVKAYEQLLGRLVDATEQAETYLQLGGQYLRSLGSHHSAAHCFKEATRRLPPDNPMHRQALLGLCDALEVLDDRASELVVALEGAIDLEAPENVPPELHLRLAHAHERLADPVRAIAAYAAALALSPNDPAAQAGLDALGERDQCWREIEAQLSTLSDAHLTIIDLRCKALKRLGEAALLADLRRLAVGLATTSEEATARRFAFAQALEDLEHTDEAISQYEAVIATDTTHRRALEALYRLHHARYDSDSLLAVLTQLVALDQGAGAKTEHLLELASIEQLRGRTESAAEHYEHVLNREPSHQPSLDALEQIYAETDQLALAGLLCRRAKLLEAGSPRDGGGQTQQATEYLLRAAELFETRSEPAEAHAAFTRATAIAPSHHRALTEFERFAYKHRLWDELLKLYNDRITGTEDGSLKSYHVADLYVRRGQLQLRGLGEAQPAMASFWRALESDPNAEDALASVTALLTVQNDFPGLIAAYERHAQLFDDEFLQLDSLRSAARIASEMMATPPDGEPLRLWHRVLKINPADDEALGTLITIYRQIGAADPLADLLRTRIAIHPDHPDTLAMRLELGRLCEVDLDQPDQAALAFEKVRELDELNEVALTSLARIYEALGDWQGCLDALNGLVMLEARPDERSVLYFKCGSITETRFADSEGAIHLYRRSLEENAGCLPSIHGLRELYLASGQWSNALATLELELDLWEGKRERAGILCRMAALLRDQMEAPADARWRLEQALELDPYSSTAMLGLFFLAINADDDTLALELAQRISDSKNEPHTTEERVEFYFHFGRLLHASESEADADAVAYFIQALDLAPTHFQALDVLLAVVTTTSQELDIAPTLAHLAEVYRKTDQRPGLAKVLWATGKLLERAGDADGALLQFGEAVSTDKSDCRAAVDRATLLVRLGDPRSASSSLHTALSAIEASPGLATAWLYLADLRAAHIDSPEGAIEALRAAIAADPTLFPARFRLTEELLAIGQFESAQAELAQCRTISDGEISPILRARALHLEGLLLLDRSDTLAARRSFEQALAIAPSCIEASLALAHLHRDDGEFPTAEQIIKSCLGSQGPVHSPGNIAELRRALAAIQLAAPRPDDALRSYRRIAKSPGGSTGDHLVVAELQTLTNQPQAAMETLSALLESGELSAQLLERLADLHQRQGATERALAALRAAEIFADGSESQRGVLAALERQHPWSTSHPLDERQQRLLWSPPTEPTIDELWRAALPALTRVFPLPSSAARLSSMPPVPEEARRALDETIALFDGHFDITAAKSLRSTLVACDREARLHEGEEHRPKELRLGNEFLALPDTQARFVAGRVVGLSIQGYELLDRLPFDDLQLLEELLADLLMPAGTRSDLAEEFLSRVAPGITATIDQISEEYAKRQASGRHSESPWRWIQWVGRCGNACGLLASDNLGQALTVIGTAESERIEMEPHPLLAARVLEEGHELVQFSLSERYHRLRRHIAAA